jgi:hypothetical protein
MARRATSGTPIAELLALDGELRQLLLLLLLSGVELLKRPPLVRGVPELRGLAPELAVEPGVRGLFAGRYGCDCHEPAAQEPRLPWIESR